jgi:hypothetical protein
MKENNRLKRDLAGVLYACTLKGGWSEFVSILRMALIGCRSGGAILPARLHRDCGPYDFIWTGWDLLLFDVLPFTEQATFARWRGRDTEGKTEESAEEERLPSL